MGSKGRPFYRVVVADQRSPRDGRFIENIGRYHPLNDPSLIEIDQDRALHWLRVGAQPSDQVRNLMQKTGIWDVFVAERPKAAVVSTKPERPVKEKVSKKAQAKAAEASKGAAAPALAEAPAPAKEAPAAAAPTDAETPAEPEAPAEAEAPTEAEAAERPDAAAEDSAEA
jgi:small subunit ribosomal protein S16